MSRNVEKAVTTQHRNWRVFLVILFGLLVLTFPFLGPEVALLLGGLGILLYAFNKPSRPLSRSLRWLGSIVEVVLVGPRWGQRWAMDLGARMAERRGPVFWITWTILVALVGIVGLATLGNAWDLAVSGRYDERVLTYAEHPVRWILTLIMQALSGVVWLGLFGAFAAVPFVARWDEERLWQRRLNRPPLDTARRRPAVEERPGPSASVRATLASWTRRRRPP